MELMDLETVQDSFLVSCSERAQDERLSDLLRSHLEITETHLCRLKELGHHLKPSRYEAAHCAIKHILEVTSEGEASPEAIDAALISGIQELKHLEIAKYGTLRTYCEDLGLFSAADSVGTSLEEDAMFDRKLSRLAERYVNLRAADA